MYAAGKTVKEIAENMFISVKTVSTYKVRIFEKMKLESRADITSYAIKNKLID
jgi:DNA-binding NarL/FixJ family response regulator